MRRERIPELDGFRVAAVFIVALFHIWQQSWLRPEVLGIDLEFAARAGYVLVDATILLSGFLLYLPWAEADRAPESVGGFYRRRAARILPAFLFVTLFMLFAQALPADATRESWRPDLVKDVVTHVTLIFPFFEDTYQYTLLGGASWTVAIEAHFYLLFPLLARLARRRPGWVLGGMTAAAAWFRIWCLWTQESYQMTVNQMANFLDVYALGMGCAMIWPHLRRLREKLWRRRFAWRVLLGSIATTVMALGVAGLVLLMKDQARQTGSVAIQGTQMVLRPVYALCYAAILLSLPLTLWPVRKLFGNPVTRFLAGVSMNFYLLHQNIAVLLKTPTVRAWLETPRAWLGNRPLLQSPAGAVLDQSLRQGRLPDFLNTGGALREALDKPRALLGHGSILYSSYAAPNQAYDLQWQVRYTALCFLLSLAAAILVTYLIEKPCARLILWKRRKRPDPASGPSEGRNPDETPADPDALPEPADSPVSPDSPR